VVSIRKLNLFGICFFFWGGGGGGNKYRDRAVNPRSKDQGAVYIDRYKKIKSDGGVHDQRMCHVIFNGHRRIWQWACRLRVTP